MQGTSFLLLSDRSLLIDFTSLCYKRTSFRLLYAVVLLILSADGFTKHASINHHVFWVDAFYVLAIFGIFTSMIASLFVSLQDS